MGHVYKNVNVGHVYKNVNVGHVYKNVNVGHVYKNVILIVNNENRFREDGLRGY